jgi:hypothetical protein
MIELLTLEKLYQDAAKDLLEAIEKKSINGGLALYQRAVLAQVTEILNGLSAEARAWVKEFVPPEYLLAVDETADLLKEGLGITHSITQLDREAIDALVKNATKDLVEANVAIGRRVNDVFRDIQLSQTSAVLARGSSARQVQQAVLKELMTKGILKVPDSGGRQWDARAYANMVGRSVTAEARNVGRINTMTQTGNDLVQIVKNNTSCPICSRYEGRVYSISGNDKRFPALYQTAFGKGYNLLHPGCRHALTPFVEGLQTRDEFNEVKRVSNLSFNPDRRSERAKRAYDKAQIEKRQARATREQFERYRTVLKDKAPKTLAGFSNIKSKGGESWQNLQNEYRAVKA